jgi:hypothetical protein
MHGFPSITAGSTEIREGGIKPPSSIRPRGLLRSRSNSLLPVWSFGPNVLQFGMIKSKAEILQSIAALPDEERQELVEHLIATRMDGPGVLDRLAERDRADLSEGIAQADRGQVISSDELKDRMARRFGFAAR